MSGGDGRRGARATRIAFAVLAALSCTRVPTTTLEDAVITATGGALTAETTTRTASGSLDDTASRTVRLAV